VDFDHGGRRVLASRLGWRITARFVQTFCGRVLGNPSALFDEEFLQPEKQDLDVYADGVDNIVAAMREAAGHYFEDESVNEACPPLRALLHIMRDGSWNGHGADHPALRSLFTREALLASDWYRARLEAQQTVDAQLWASRARYLEKFLTLGNYADVAARLDIRGRLAKAIEATRAARAPESLARLRGTLGAEPAIAAKLASVRLV
jgi:hypothetical protein